MQLAGDFAKRFPDTARLLARGVAEGVAPGFVAGVWRAGSSMGPSGEAWIGAAGSRRSHAGAQPMETATVFDLASLTKLFTATLTASLIDRGWLRWELPLAEIFPDYAHRAIRLDHLLSHTAGFIAWQPFWETLRLRWAPRAVWEVAVAERQRAMRELVFAVAPEVAPATRALYSDVSMLLLGFVLEEVLKLPLDRAITDFVFSPMSLPKAYFHRITRRADQDVHPEVAATEDSEWRGGVLQGQVHDDNTWAMGGYAGHAGAFGTAESVLEFARHLMACRFLKPETLARMWARAPEPAGCARTYGWDTPSGSEPAASRAFSPRSVGHLGFTGTSLWIDPDAGIAVALLSNRVHPSRDNNLIRAFRPLFHQTLRDELG